MIVRPASAARRSPSALGRCLALLLLLGSEVGGCYPRAVRTTAHRRATQTPPIFGPEDSISTAAQAMREELREAGVAEVDLPWFTPEERGAREHSAPAWEHKVDGNILGRLRLLQERDLLGRDRRRLAAGFSTSDLAVDREARLKVILEVIDTALFDQQFLRGIGGQLDTIRPRLGSLQAWVPAEQIRTLAERPDVKTIRSPGRTLSN